MTTQPNLMDKMITHGPRYTDALRQRTRTEVHLSISRVSGGNIFAHCLWYFYGTPF